MAELNTQEIEEALDLIAPADQRKIVSDFFREQVAKLEDSGILSEAVTAALIGAGWRPAEQRHPPGGAVQSLGPPEPRPFDQLCFGARENG